MAVELVNVIRLIYLMNFFKNIYQLKKLNIKYILNDKDNLKFIKLWEKYNNDFAINMENFIKNKKGN